MNLLIAEDDLDMQKILALYLRREGYHVETVADGAAAVEFLAQRPVDLVLLDWMMPVKDGLSACREIRRLRIPVKILMLTAKGQNEDEIAGLSCGADDYLRKPFDMQVLLLRIRKLCNAQGVLRCGSLTLNPATGEAGEGERKLELTRTEYELLKYFMGNQRIILSRELLLDRVWGMDFQGDIRTVDTHVRRLRKKIGAEYIRTRIGMGYVMEAPHE
ncbi:MAG: response regulator transcription factor [Clostridium sp.]|nr:response regulator transcription factor [Clostridium sp.]